MNVCKREKLHDVIVNPFVLKWNKHLSTSGYIGSEGIEDDVTLFLLFKKNTYVSQ